MISNNRLKLEIRKVIILSEFSQADMGYLSSPLNTFLRDFKTQVFNILVYFRCLYEVFIHLIL